MHVNIDLNEFIYSYIYICIYAVMQHVIYKVTNNRSYKINALEKKVAENGNTCSISEKNLRESN